MRARNSGSCCFRERVRHREFISVVIEDADYSFGTTTRRFLFYYSHFVNIVALWQLSVPRDHDIPRERDNAPARMRVD